VISTVTAQDRTHREREIGEMIRAFNDVTERLKLSHERLGSEVRRLRDQLDEKNRELARRERLAALGEMAAGVAHEIRNPLAGIRLYASLLQRDLKDRPGQLELIGKIDRGIVALDGLVGDILLFAGNAEPDLQDVRAQAIVEEMLALVAPQRNTLSATIEVDGALSRLILRCDVGQVTRAMLNLVLNALDAAGTGGRVQIRAGTHRRVAGATVSDGCESGFTHRRVAGATLAEVWVEDNGPGIAEDLMDRVFNPFFTTRDNGTGLGLAIVHRIAEGHGGCVTASNLPEGGARFTLALPRGAGFTGESPVPQR